MSKYIRHYQYGCFIEGDVPGPYTVTHCGEQLGIAQDMAAAVQMAKKACNESASVFDHTPTTLRIAENTDDM